MGITGVYQQETDHYYLKKNGAKDRKFTDFETLIAAIRKAQANRKVKYLNVTVYLAPGYYSGWRTLGDFNRDAAKWTFYNLSLKPHIRHFVSNTVKKAPRVTKTETLKRKPKLGSSTVNRVFDQQTGESARGVTLRREFPKQIS